MESIPLNYDNLVDYAVFSDPIDDAHVDLCPAPALHDEPPLSNSKWSLDDGLSSLEALTRHKLRPQQREALSELYNGNNVVLVVTTGFRKMLVITGFYNLIPLA